MKDEHFNQVIGKLKGSDYLYQLTVEGEYEIWRKFSRYVTVPVNCRSQTTANAVMRAAGIWHEFGQEEQNYFSLFLQRCFR